MSDRAHDLRLVVRPQRRVDGRLVGLTTPRSFEADQYRILKHSIERQSEGELRSIAITSPGMGEGKTITSINLAAAYAQTPDTKTLLVDADMRRPAILSRLGLDPQAHAGLSELLAGPGTPIDTVIGRWLDQNLWILPAGRLPDDPYRLLESSALEALVADLEQRFDRIVFDLPPVIPVLDGRLVSRWVDAVLLVVAAKRTQRREVEEAIRIVEPDRLLGLVLNEDDQMPAHPYLYSRREGRPKEDRPRP
jgi:capsular exopolysaccharide synthesis family protein